MSITFESKDYNELQTNNVDLLINGVAASGGETINVGDTLKMVCKSGFVFSQDVEYPRGSPKGQTGPGCALQGRTNAWTAYSHFYPFTLDSETEATFNYDSDADSESYSSAPKFFAKTEQPSVVVTGTNKVYSVNNDTIKEVNLNRFYSTVGNDGKPSGTVDYGQYIISLIELPTAIGSDLILEPEAVELGDKQLSVKAPVVAKDVFVIDMGTISVPSINGNSLDYANTVCNLHLPYANSVALELEYVIGEDLSIVYNIDAYTGDATINITSSKTNEVFLSKKVSLGINIPYGAFSRSQATVDNANIEQGGNNGIKSPYVEIFRNESPLAKSFFSVPIQDDGLLLGNVGYIEVENIALEFNVIANEKQKIMDQLNDGVIIND